MLDVQHYSKTYGKTKKAVDDLSLSVAAGDIYGFIGHNGAGKSTLIRSIVGILDFEAGDILVDGHSIKKEPLACKAVTAYVPDNPEPYEHLTGIAYLNFIADIYRVPANLREERIGKYAEMFEITGDLGDTISAYSHGMKQKLILISALLHQPKLLVLDEPFVGLDPLASARLKAVMKELCAQGSAIFFSTHVLEVAEKLCNKVAIIRQGKLVAAGDMEALTKDSSLEGLFMEVAVHEED